MRIGLRVLLIGVLSAAALGPASLSGHCAPLPEGTPEGTPAVKKEAVAPSPREKAYEQLDLFVDVLNYVQENYVERMSLDLP